MRSLVSAIAVLATSSAIWAISPRLSGAEKPAAALRPTDALIVREGVLPASGVGKLSAIRVADPNKLATLEAFFPRYRERPTSDLAGGWMAGHRVYFTFPGGETIRVTVSENDRGRSWSVGRGDFATRGDFLRFVEDLDH